MRLGKVKESIWQRSVLRQLHRRSEEGSPAPGEDAGLFIMGGDSCPARAAVSVAPVEGWTLAAPRAVYGAVNALAAAGAEPEAMTVTILLPEEAQENALKALMRDMDRLCQEEKITLVAGHAAVSPYVRDLVLSVNAIGSREAAAALSPVPSLAGMALVAAGTVGREGAAMLALEREEQLMERYSASYIEKAKHLFDGSSMREAAAILRQSGAAYLHHVREGGVFAGLWEAAAACKVGLDVDLKSIPIRQHTIEVCEYFNLNPYMLRSGGCLLAVCPDGERAVRMLEKSGIEAAVIGEATDGNDRIIRYDDEIRFLEPPKSDEYYKTVTTV